jgi:hypothetical protein
MKARLPRRAPLLWQTYHRLRFTILFYVLLLFLVMMPIVTTFGLPGLFMKLQVGACLLAAVMPNATRRTWRAMVVALSLLVLVQIVPALAVSPDPAFVLALTAFTLLAAAAGALRFAVTTPAVTSETVYAALSTYLLAGISFGQIYWLVETLQAGSLTGPDPFSEPNAVYFSFVTLATLGYGDFLPQTAVARGIATFEVIGGQLFLAVLVARLIGVFGSKEP